MRMLACLIGTLMIAGVASADDAKPKVDPMAEMMKYAGPGPQHEKLKAMVGTWDATVKTWMGPGEPTVEKGVMKNAMTLGGRLLESNYTGTYQGQTFDGLGLTGYDLKAGKLRSFWTDSGSTSWSIMEGSMSDDGMELASTGTMDGMDGKPMSVRTETKIEGPDKHVYTMYGTVQGKEVRMMEITYDRKK